MMNLDFKISRRSGKLHGVAFKGNSSTQSNPVNTTQVTDQRVAASEGSVSAGAGATVSVVQGDIDAVSKIAQHANDTGESIAKESILAATDQTRAAVGANADVSRTAIQENADVSKAALGTVAQQGRDALDFGTKAVEAVRAQGQDALTFGHDIFSNASALVSHQGDSAFDFAKDVAASAFDNAKQTQQSANELVQRTNDSFTAKLAANAGEAPQALADNVVKYVSIAAGIIGIVAVFRKKS